MSEARGISRDVARALKALSPADRRRALKEIAPNATRERARFVWGRAVDQVEIAEIAAPPARVRPLLEIRQTIYYTRKGQRSLKSWLWDHEHEAPYPLLVARTTAGPGARARASSDVPRVRGHEAFAIGRLKQLRGVDVATGRARTIAFPRGAWLVSQPRRGARQSMHIALTGPAKARFGDLWIARNGSRYDVQARGIVR